MARTVLQTPFEGSKCRHRNHTGLRGLARCPVILNSHISGHPRRLRNIAATCRSLLRCGRGAAISMSPLIRRFWAATSKNTASDSLNLAGAGKAFSKPTSFIFTGQTSFSLLRAYVFECVFGSNCFGSPPIGRKAVPSSGRSITYGRTISRGSIQFGSVLSWLS
jgi:hypothetical protein